MIRTGLIITLVFFLAAAALGALGWINTAPGELVPVHIGLSGEPDRYGSKWEAFALTPAVILGIGLLLAIFPKIDPRGRNLSRSGAPYLTAWIGGLAIATLAQGLITWTAIRGPDAAATMAAMRLIAIGVAIMFTALGNFLPKARPNFFLGIRTPWTLTSDLSWEKTHRLAGRLWLLTGLVGLVAALFAPATLAIVVIVAGALGSALIAVIYSYLVWRSAPDRRMGPQPD